MTQQSVRLMNRREQKTSSCRLPQAALRTSYRHCHEVTRTRARNFYYGLRLTPEPWRSAIYVIYAFMRACDDLVDDNPSNDSTNSPGCSEDSINAFRLRMTQVCEDPHAALDGTDDPNETITKLWPAFHDVVTRYEIPQVWFHDMLDGQLDDLAVRRYETFDELRHYCYKVASVVGLVCITIWGFEGERETRRMAEHRGIALQLTNILRDLKEDAGRDRIYLPADELRRFGVTESQLLTGSLDSNYDDLIHFQVVRAREYYNRSEALEQCINPACRATSWAMMRIYRGLLDQIDANPRRVFQQRVRLSCPAKFAVTIRASLKRFW